MGYIVPGICQTRKVGSPTQKAVLMALASYAWDDGSSVWVTKATLAADLEMGHRTVQDAIRALVEKGLLIVVGEREIKHGFTVEYRIDLDAVEALEQTRDPRKKTFKNGCGSRTPVAKTGAAAAPTGAGDCSNGCGSRTQLSKEYINKPPCAQAREAEEEEEGSNSEFSKGFWTDLLDALNVDPTSPGKWWSGEVARKHVAGWLRRGLSEERILEVARKSREKQPEAPNGPKALDAAMTAAASAPKPASATDVLAFWAEKLRGSAYVAPSSLSISLANELLRRGLVATDDLRRRGIAFTFTPSAHPMKIGA